MSGADDVQERPVDDFSNRSTASWMARMLRHPLAWYGRMPPYFPGKWRTIDWFTSLSKDLSDGSYLVTRRGLRWQLDLRCLIQRSLYYLGWYEVWETKYLQSVIQPGWYVFDVGANIGYHSLLAGKLVGSNGRVYAFEPATAVYGQLLRNLQLNNMPWVHPIRKALCDQEGTAYIEIAPPQRQGSRPISFEAQSDREPIETTTMDAFMKATKCSRLDLVKVDIEGREPGFFRGAAQTLDHYRPLVMFEVYPAGLYAFQSSPGELIAQIAAKDYDLFTFKRRQIIRLDEIPDPRSHTNILAIPKERR